MARYRSQGSEGSRGQRSQGPQMPLLPAGPDGQAGLRHLLLHTLPGRLIVIGVAVRVLLVGVSGIAGALPAALNVVDTAAGLAIAAGAGYFVFRLFLVAKRRLLWRGAAKAVSSLILAGFVSA